MRDKHPDDFLQLLLLCSFLLFKLYFLTLRFIVIGKSVISRHIIFTILFLRPNFRTRIVEFEHSNNYTWVAKKV